MPSRLSLFYEACCGCCLSEAEERSRQIDKQIFEDGRRYRSQINVLLLGTPDSGKSTFLKQARICYGQNFTSDELKELRPIIYGDILEGMQVLVNAVEKMDLEWQYPCNQVNADKILSYQRSKNIDVDTFRGYFDCLKSLWMDAAIQIAFDGRRELQMGKSSEYFLKHLERVGRPDYLPTKVDGVYASERPGIVKYEFIQESCTFNIIDVDDQRCYNSNYKWYKFPCFQNISSIVFCVSPNGYDEVVTNGATNGLEDSLTLFDRIVNHRFFSNASVILLFNDTDLLMEKIQHSNIKQYFPDFQGDPQKPEDVRCYIFELFDRQLRERSHILYHHFTTANDIENFRFVFASVKDTVLQNCFKSLNKD